MADAFQDSVAEYAKADKLKRDLDAKLKAVKARLQELEAGLLNEFSRVGIQNVKVGNLTLYVHQQLWPSPRGDRGAVVAALKASGYGDLISENYNHNQLASLVREFPRGDDGLPVLPDELSSALDVTERFSIRSRRK